MRLPLLLALLASPPASPDPQQVRRSFEEYVADLNAHDVDRVMRFYAPDLVRRREGRMVDSPREALRDIRLWERPMEARFDADIVFVRGDRLTARLTETNALYTTLGVRRPQVSEYRWRDGLIVEMHLKEIRDAGRVWRAALGELEDWLARKPSLETARVLQEGRLQFTAEGGRRLLPFLQEYGRLVAAARAPNEAALTSFVAALNRHDVDAQYRHYAKDMHYVDGDQRIAADKENERLDREFEGASGARWSFEALGAGLDSLEVVMTHAMDFYDRLGVGARRHRARYRFGDGKILEAKTWDWTQHGRPYGGAQRLLAAWVQKERPEEARRVLADGRLRFTRETAAVITTLAKEWADANPCRIYHPSFNPTGSQLLFSSDCEGPWGLYVAEADGTMPRRVTPPDTEARMPRWSPDGSRIVFQSNRSGNWEIEVVNVDGSGSQRLTDHPAVDGSPAFSPDGSRVAFASDRSGTSELFLVPAAGGEAVQLTHGKGVGFRSVWSADGSHVLYHASTPPSPESGEQGEFFRVRPDGGDAGKLAGGKRREYNQAYSPDGRAIAFDAHEDGTSWESGTEWDVWVMDAEGNGRRNLTAGNGRNDWGPAWSPDGRTISFSSGLENVYDVYWMNADGSGRRRLTYWTAAFPAAR